MEALAANINPVRELVEHVRGSKQATKLIDPMFTMQGSDLTDPWQVVTEYRYDLGKERSHHMTRAGHRLAQQ